MFQHKKNDFLKVFQSCSSRYWLCFKVAFSIPRGWIINAFSVVEGLSKTFRLHQSYKGTFSLATQVAIHLLLFFLMQQVVVLEEPCRAAVSKQQFWSTLYENVLSVVTCNALVGRIVVPLQFNWLLEKVKERRKKADTVYDATFLKKIVLWWGQKMLRFE